ncbi:hypothetical protein WMY93_021227 [Mugilogobius chulae]|uniref:Lipoma HMGIC fusion partner-like 2 protein n=1 Tax=Mugilogobius chulae TaxID=88201 RepID=A0AAW0NEZ0_9GOBI
MCHVIVTCRSMLWTLLSIVAAFGELIAFMSTDWLVGYPRTPDAVFGPHGATTAGEAYRPTLGIYGRCIKLPHLQRGILCGPYAVHFGEIASGDSRVVSHPWTHAVPCWLGSDKVQLYCGPDAAPYRAGLCSMGWAFYTAMGGTVLTFVCAVFSAQAEIATSSDKVQEEIEEGKSLICLL